MTCKRQCRKRRGIIRKKGLFDKKDSTSLDVKEMSEGITQCLKDLKNRDGSKEKNNKKPEKNKRKGI